jgi:hypothetical protein
MKSITLIGVFLLVLGVLALVVPIPRRENHGVKVGETKIGVQTETNEKVPPAVGIVLIAGGGPAFGCRGTQDVGQAEPKDLKTNHPTERLRTLVERPLPFATSVQ